MTFAVWLCLMNPAYECVPMLELGRTRDHLEACMKLTMESRDMDGCLVVPVVRK